MKIRACITEKKDHDIILWHYTTPEVLWKMLSGEFYATHYRFMNDSAEIIYGIQEFKHFFDREKGLDSFRLMVKYLQMIDFFLLCFSEFSDSLYHWRSYAPKGGFSIGFSHNEMCDIFNNIEYDLQDKIQLHYDLVKCQYLSEDEIDGFMRETTGKIQKAIQVTSSKYKIPVDQSTYVANLFKSLNNIYNMFAEILSHCPAFKTPSFAVEQEYRLVISGGDLRTQIEFIGNKPRIKIPTPELLKCIKGVYVSPHGDVEQNYLLAEIAKERFGLDFEIHRSQSTFNGK